MSPAAAKKKKRNVWLLFAVCLAATAAVVMLYSAVAGPRNLFRVAELQKRKESLLHEIDSLENRRTELLAEKKRLLTDTTYLEKLARKELGMARPGEKVYRFLDPAPSRGDDDTGSRTHD